MSQSRFNDASVTMIFQDRVTFILKSHIVHNAGYMSVEIKRVELC